MHSHPRAEVQREEEQLGVSGSLPGDTFAINCRTTNSVSLRISSPQPRVKLNINGVKEV